MPHVIAKTDGARKKIAIVGAGPAGLEAARVSASRGHEVILFEAAGNPGGQIRVATQVKRRKELIGIADWRADQCERLGVEMRFNTYAEADELRGARCRHRADCDRRPAAESRHRGRRRSRGVELGYSDAAT